MMLLGWNEKEWAIVNKWWASVFSDWNPGPAEVRRLWQHAHMTEDGPANPMWSLEDRIARIEKFLGLD